MPTCLTLEALVQFLFFIGWFSSNSWSHGNGCSESSSCYNCHNCWRSPGELIVHLHYFAFLSFLGLCIWSHLYMGLFPWVHASFSILSLQLHYFEFVCTYLTCNFRFWWTVTSAYLQTNCWKSECWNIFGEHTPCYFWHKSSYSQGEYFMCLYSFLCIV